MKIIRSLKEGDDQGDEVHRQTCEEAASGTMLTPVPLEEWMMDKMTFIRRFGVKEYREHCGWRSRIVDHCPEAGISYVTST
jgi:hypothetical protein